MRISTCRAARAVASQWPTMSIGPASRTGLAWQREAHWQADAQLEDFDVPCSNGTTQTLRQHGGATAPTGRRRRRRNGITRRSDGATARRRCSALLSLDGRSERERGREASPWTAVAREREGGLQGAQAPLWVVAGARAALLDWAARTQWPRLGRGGAKQRLCLV